MKELDEFNQRMPLCYHKKDVRKVYNLTYTFYEV